MPNYEKSTRFYNILLMSFVMNFFKMTFKNTLFLTFWLWYINTNKYL